MFINTQHFGARERPPLLVIRDDRELGVIETRHFPLISLVAGRRIQEGSHNAQ